MNPNQQYAEGQMKSSEELGQLIHKAIKKIGGKKENDLCKFLPAHGGGYMHHFTLRKMKTESPAELGEMIEKFIIHPEQPGRVSPKPRAARGSRKKRDVITLTRGDLDRMLDLARQVGDKEMVAKLSPKKSPATLKRELIKTIKEGRVDPELWQAYAEILNTHNTPNAATPYTTANLQTAGR
ncbi:MAG: hypothetical protein JHC93_08315 [Parachlamydiales bacterium]|nr:hypothetical protein [Parachlamydiales bacterium]